MLHYGYTSFFKKKQQIGTIRNRVLWKRTPIGMSLFLSVLIWSILLIFGTPFYTLVYPFIRKIFILRDNNYVLDSTIHTHTNLHKHHIALSFNQVWEDIAFKMFALYHVSGGDNPNDIIYKHWSYINIWKLFSHCYSGWGLHRVIVRFVVREGWWSSIRRVI